MHNSLWKGTRSVKAFPSVFDCLPSNEPFIPRYFFARCFFFKYDISLLPHHIQEMWWHVNKTAQFLMEKSVIREVWKFNGNYSSFQLKIFFGQVTIFKFEDYSSFQFQKLWGFIASNSSENYSTFHSPNFCSMICWSISNSAGSLKANWGLTCS